MRQTPESPNPAVHDDAPTLPSKSEIIAVLQGDGSRAGLQLEWVLDHCALRQGALK